MHFPTNSSSSSFDDATDKNIIVREEEDQSAVNRRQSLLLGASVAGTSLFTAFPAKSNDAPPENGVYDFTVRQYGKPFAFAKY